MRRRLIIVILLVAIAAIAGMVRSNSGAVTDIKRLVSHNETGQTREEKRETYELAPGARVEVFNINGSVKVETSDTKTADIFIERIGSSAEALSRRTVAIEHHATSLRIYGEKINRGFWARLFGSSPSERVTLKLPRQISLVAKGVNGSVVAGDVEGRLEVRGVNGRVEIGSTSGNVDLKGINGNVVLALKELNVDAVNMNGINGNIELRLTDRVNGYLDVKGINGRVVSESAQVNVDRVKRNRYWVQIGSGGNSINAKGINGNIHLTRPTVSNAVVQAETKAESGNAK